MYKYRAKQYSKKLCFKCLEEKENIKTYIINNKGYEDGSLDGLDTKIQLCAECDNGLDVSNNKEILELAELLPIQGQELFYNTCNKGWSWWNYKPSQWIEQAMHENINLDCTHSYELIDSGIIVKHCWFEDHENCEGCKSFKKREKGDNVARLTRSEPIWISRRKFDIGDIVKIKNDYWIFSKGYRGGKQGRLHSNTEYKITDYREIKYRNGRTYYEYYIDRTSCWVQQNDIYKVGE